MSFKLLKYLHVNQMNYKSYIGAALLVVAVGFAGYLFKVERSGSQGGQATAVKGSSNGQPKFSQPESSINNGNNCNEGEVAQKYRSDTAFRSLAVNQAQIDDLIMDGYVNVKPLLSKVSSGDKLAAIAAFNMVRQCYSLKISNPAAFGNSTAALPSSNPSCPAFPRHLAESPLSILLPAAAKGAEAAKSVFATNAVSMAAYYKRLGTKESIDYANDILEKAQQYGDSSARSGIIESVLFMANAHQTGIFGHKNEVLAFAYAIPLTKIPNSNERIFANGLALKLTQVEVDRANRIAYGCGNMKKIDGANPFN